jgi:hypothetical protein
MLVQLQVLRQVAHEFVRERNTGAKSLGREFLLQGVVSLFVQHAHALRRGPFAGGHLGKHDVAAVALKRMQFEKSADARPRPGQHHWLGAVGTKR